MVNFFKMMFFYLLISSTFISISALSWFTAWMGLEMNLLAMMPLMKTKKNKITAEASIKYFIVQAMASSILLFSIILFSNMNLLNIKSLIVSSTLMNLALILKLGMAPLHFWLPEVISGLNWMMVFVILTWQKIAPMILLSYCLDSLTFLSIIIILSTITSGIQGMNQICLRKIMAFSSINHMGWMMSTLFSSLNLWIYYFTIYLIMNLNIMFIFWKFHTFYFTQLNKLFSNTKKLKFFFMMNMLSLGGLPPFIGFLPKWMTINFLSNSQFFTLSFILLVLTLMALYFYTRIAFSSFIFHKIESIYLYQTKKLSMTFFSLNFLNLMSLPFSFMIIDFA